MKLLTAIPYGVRVILVGILLTCALGWMVWARISLLETGKEVVLKTAPIDPRDLFRGHYVRLNYDISRITSETVEKMPETPFRRHQPIYVSLRKAETGYWQPVAVAHSKAKLMEDAANETTAIIAGKVRYVSHPLRRPLQPTRRPRQENSTAPEGATQDREKITEINIRYGIEKYFLPKLEALRFERERNEREIAVIAKLSEAGEAAIGGLMIDGKKIYDEPLF